MLNLNFVFLLSLLLNLNIFKVICLDQHDFFFVLFRKPIFRRIVAFAFILIVITLWRQLTNHPLWATYRRVSLVDVWILRNYDLLGCIRLSLIAFFLCRMKGESLFGVIIVNILEWFSVFIILWREFLTKCIFFCQCITVILATFFFVFSFLFFRSWFIAR